MQRLLLRSLARLLCVALGLLRLSLLGASGPLVLPLRVLGRFLRRVLLRLLYFFLALTGGISLHQQQPPQQPHSERTSVGGRSRLPLLLIAIVELSECSHLWVGAQRLLGHGWQRSVGCKERGSWCSAQDARSGERRKWKDGYEMRGDGEGWRGDGAEDARQRASGKWRTIVRGWDPLALSVSLLRPQALRWCVLVLLFSSLPAPPFPSLAALPAPTPLFRLVSAALPHVASLQSSNPSPSIRSHSVQSKREGGAQWRERGAQWAVAVLTCPAVALLSSSHLVLSTSPCSVPRCPKPAPPPFSARGIGPLPCLRLSSWASPAMASSDGDHTSSTVIREVTPGPAATQTATASARGDRSGMESEQPAELSDR